MLRKDDNGKLLLSKILAINNNELVQKALNMLLNSELTEDNKIQILQAKDNQGFTWLSSNFNTNSDTDADTIASFTNAILQSNLSANAKVELLRIKDENNKLN